MDARWWIKQAVCLLTVSRRLKKASSFVLVHPLHAAWQRVPVRGSIFLGAHCASGCNGFTPLRSLRPRHGNGCVLARLGRAGENNAFLNLLDGSLRSLRLTPTHVASKRQVIFFQQPFSKWHPEAGGPRKRIHLMTPLFSAQSESGPRTKDLRSEATNLRAGLALGRGILAKLLPDYRACKGDW